MPSINTRGEIIVDRIRVGLIDDHPVVREGLRVFLESSLDIEVTLDCARGDEALVQLSGRRCDVILLDLVLREGPDGVATFDAIMRQWPHLKIIVLTSYRDTDSLAYLRSHGARGYLDKTVEPDDLLMSIRQVAKGRSIWDPSLPGPVRQLPLEPLTPRETDVLRLLAEGLSNKEIAHRLGIREKTVKVHVSHLLGKLSVYDRTQAVIAAHQAGLVRLSSTEPRP